VRLRHSVRWAAPRSGGFKSLRRSAAAMSSPGAPEGGTHQCHEFGVVAPYRLRAETQIRQRGRLLDPGRPDVKCRVHQRSARHQPGARSQHWSSGKSSRRYNRVTRATYEGFDIGEFAIFHATRTATLTLVKEA